MSNLRCINKLAGRLEVRNDVFMRLDKPSSRCRGLFKDAWSTHAPTYIYMYTCVCFQVGSLKSVFPFPLGAVKLFFFLSVFFYFSGVLSLNSKTTVTDYG